ncbi:replication initiation protein [Clostridium botulinum]|nr:replication initiation protein [Clostridium botulinum]
MDKNYLVTKSNYFIMNSSYDLSLEEQKIILTLASMVQPSDEEFKPYIFKISEFMELLGVDTKTKYSEIPKITKELMKKVIEIQEGNTLLQVSWLNSVRYEKGSGMVTLKFSPDLKPYMLQLKEKFTQYQLANVLSMKSKYSPRVYEILKCNEFKKQGYIEIEVEDLRKLIKADTVYPKYNDFKRYVIERTQKELRKISDISFDFEEIKTGRKITSVKFYIKPNKKANAPKPITDEVSVTVTQDNKLDLQKGIESIISMMRKHKITASEAMAIYKDGEGNLNHIAKIYEHFKNKQADDTFVGLIRKMVRPGAFNEPKKSSGTSSFNNFKAREYDYDSLEKKLLGWED